MNFDLTKDAAYRLPGIPERRTLGVRWVDRLDEWRDVVTVQSFPEFAHVQAGNKGESLLRRALGRHEVTRFGELFCCKRVARVAGSAATGRFELDIVVVTPPAHRGLRGQALERPIAARRPRLGVRAPLW